VLKRRVERIGTKLEYLEPKLKVQEFGNKRLPRLRTRVVS